MVKELHKLDITNIGRFITAGKSEFSLKNEVTGTHFTYKLIRAKHPQGDVQDVYFVRVCYEYMKFQYAGCLIIKDGMPLYSMGQRGTINADAPSIKGLVWLFDRVLNDKPWDNRMGLYHFGRCGRCGRTLTDPESIQIGLGPECRRR